jgi:hypothetical protein
MAVLSESWQQAAARLAELGALAPERQRAHWRIELDDGPEVSRVLANLPGRYRHCATRSSEACDETGEGVDYDSVSELYACDAERAIVVGTDLTVIGWVGRVRVYDNDAAYARALSRTLAQFEQ